MDAPPEETMSEIDELKRRLAILTQDNRTLRGQLCEVRCVN